MLIYEVKWEKANGDHGSIGLRTSALEAVKLMQRHKPLIGQWFTVVERSTLDDTVGAQIAVKTCQSARSARIAA